MIDTTATSAPDLSAPPQSQSLRFYGIWAVAAVLLVVLPLVFSSGGALTSFSLVGITIIFALSYNILLGQTGLLSFGHAVYYGLGGFLAVHAMNAVVARGWPIPLPLIPLFVASIIPAAVVLLFPKVESLADLYAIGVVGAIAINLGSISTNRAAFLRTVSRHPSRLAKTGLTQSATTMRPSFRFSAASSLPMT